MIKIFSGRFLLRSVRKEPTKLALIFTSCIQAFIASVVCLNLPGWCWAEIQQFALVGSSSSLHSEACNASGASDGVIHSRISQEVVCFRAAANTSCRHRQAQGLVPQSSSCQHAESQPLSFGRCSLELALLSRLCKNARILQHTARNPVCA